MKQSLIKFLTLVSIFLVTKNANAQSAILASGGKGTSIDGSVSFSIGQVDYFNFSNSTNAINLGVQQPREFFTVGVNQLQETTININVFPNPTESNCNLNLEKTMSQKYDYQLFEISGKLVFSGIAEEGENNIPMENLSAAVYVLKVFGNNTIIQTFKIIKN